MSRGGKRQLKLGVVLQPGGHWKDPATHGAGAADIDDYLEFAALAESACFDFGFVIDFAYIGRQDASWQNLSRLESLTILSALATRTRHLGLVGTFSTSYSEPYTTARQFASLDRISRGRAGWNAVTSAAEGVGRNHGHEKLHDHALRYLMADEYLTVVQGLWDSWEEGAFVRDAANGRYVDLDKLHPLNHRGEFFKVAGPLNVEPSAQRRPVQFQAGGSEAGRDLAARHADAIFASGMVNMDSPQAALDFYHDIKRRAVAHGRDPEDILVFPRISPVVADSQDQALAKHRLAARHIDIDFAVKQLSTYFSGFDFSRFALDEVLPDLGEAGADGIRSVAGHLKDVVRRDRLTLRQLALYVSARSGPFIGTPEAVADRMEALFVAPAADGFIISSTLPDFRDFVARVVPLLRERGLFRREYESGTLRGNLGLKLPPSRHGTTGERSIPSAPQVTA